MTFLSDIRRREARLGSSSKSSTFVETRRRRAAMDFSPRFNGHLNEELSGNASPEGMCSVWFTNAKASINRLCFRRPRRTCVLLYSAKRDSSAQEYRYSLVDLGGGSGWREEEEEDSLKWKCVSAFPIIKRVFRLRYPITEMNKFCPF